MGPITLPIKAQSFLCLDGPPLATLNSSPQGFEIPPDQICFFRQDIFIPLSVKGREAV